MFLKKLLVYSTITSAKVCRAEAWTFVCHELSSKLTKIDHQTTSFGRLSQSIEACGLMIRWYDRPIV